MKGSVSIVTCDGDDGFCEAWTVDHYETGATSVGGVRVSRDQPAPGWVSSSGGTGFDYCPEHRPTDSWHEFLPVRGHPDDDECTYRTDGTDETYCGEPADHPIHPSTDSGA